jgi:hypothetical protein
MPPVTEITATAAKSQLGQKIVKERERNPTFQTALS